uniref:Uncharacterized protein n=1 Tax=Vitis vinifera TaxID=29760 RepID=F6HXH5_VITVI
MHGGADQTTSQDNSWATTILLHYDNCIGY